MIQIPTFQTTSADFEQIIEINNLIVTLRIIYDIRNESFHLDFTDQDNETVYGIKIVPNWLLLNNHRGFTAFRGDLLVIKDDELLGSEITYDNFGSGYNLYGLTVEERDEWKDTYGLG